MAKKETAGPADLMAQLSPKEAAACKAFTSALYDILETVKPADFMSRQFEEHAKQNGILRSGRTVAGDTYMKKTRGGAMVIHTKAAPGDFERLLASAQALYGSTPFSAPPSQHGALHPISTSGKGDKFVMNVNILLPA